ncbi:hypothetical protein K227x_27400 [Rubripirellula lacrimiformis]|uniref:Uncharacterized protein n=1 Tax=Rubripirellula lacrimiformis TaxID=1930273 RepID=A0A517NB32_9BACT|nr:hypothetical protein K227x_27400 [Rubripirellula lacrimiformis]
MTRCESMKVAKLPSGFRARNRTARSFRVLYKKLPKQSQELIRLTGPAFDANPLAKSFRHHELSANRRGKHKSDSFSVSISMDLRAIYAMSSDKETRIWYWVGTHSQYNIFTGIK